MPRKKEVEVIEKLPEVEISQGRYPVQIFCLKLMCQQETGEEEDYDRDEEDLLHEYDEG